MIHNEPHPLAGETVQLKPETSDALAVLAPGGGGEFQVEDYWDRVSGGSWMTAQGNPAALSYAIRAGLSGKNIPADDEVLYGKIGAFGHLVHVSEVVTE